MSLFSMTSLLASGIRTSSGFGEISNTLNPSTSSNSFEVNLATSLALPTYGGLYAKRVSANECGGTSGTCWTEKAFEVSELNKLIQQSDLQH